MIRSTCLSAPLLCLSLAGLGWGQTAPVRVGGDIKPPKKVKDVAPVYPAEAKLFGIEGMVILETTINAEGSIEGIRVLRSIPLLDGGASTTVRQWQFEPTLLNGEKVPIVMTVTVNYSMGENGDMNRRFGGALLASLREGEKLEETTWPPMPAELELTGYSKISEPDGSLIYRGTIRNVSGSSLAGLRAVVVHRERFHEGEQMRETLRPTAQELGELEKGAQRDFTLRAVNEGTEQLEKVVLLFTKHASVVEQHIVPTRAPGGVLGSRD